MTEAVSRKAMHPVCWRVYQKPQNFEIIHKLKKLFLEVKGIDDFSHTCQLKFGIRQVNLCLSPLLFYLKKQDCQDGFLSKPICLLYTGMQSRRWLCFSSANEVACTVTG